MSQGVLIFIVAILVIVMVHEAGHFAVAKAFGFKATKFFVGMGPTVWSFHRGETEYGVKAFPIGGFVRIIGMNPYEEIPAEDAPRAYPNKPRWQRALLLLGGPATHWPLAFLILVVAAMTVGFPTDKASTKLEVVELNLHGYRAPAAQIGLQPGDRIVAVGGRSVDDWDDVLSYIRARGGQSATFEIEREGMRRTESVRPGFGVMDDDGNLVAFVPPTQDLVPIVQEGRRVGFIPFRKGAKVVGFLGVQPELVYEKQGFTAAASESGARIWELTKYSVIGVGDVFKMVFDGRLWDELQGRGERAPGEGPCGIVCAGRVVGQSAEKGRYLDVIGFIVGFTVFIGLMNLLPLPPLDGGHLAVLGYEAVTGRAVDVRKLIPLAAAVISFFVILFVAVLYLDLARPISLPF